MKRVFTLASILMFSSVCLAGDQNNQKAWDGFVTDMHCGTHCQRTSDMKPDKACVRECVRKGSKYGLWRGNHVYPVEPQAKVAQYEAEDVHVTGTMVNGTIRIESIGLRAK
jgi:hypothetical protein